MYQPLNTRFAEELNAVRPLLSKCLRGEKPCDLVVTNCQVLNVFTGEIYDSEVWVKGKHIVYVSHPNDPPAPQLTARSFFDADGKLLIPGFIDTHVHVESTMLPPHELGKILATWGTTTLMADPHEIGNVAGFDGFRYMWESSDSSPINQWFLIPSCVPASEGLEGVGTNPFYARQIAQLFEMFPDAPGVAEVMDYYGLIQGNPRMVDIVSEALSRNAFVQGHCFGFHGTDLANYLVCGPTSNHECQNTTEVMSALRQGMHVNLRVTSSLGSADLWRPLLSALTESKYLDLISLCTDDVHIGDILEKGHLNASIARLLQNTTLNIVDLVRMASLNGWREYGVQNAGAIAPGHIADFQLVEDNSFTKQPTAVFVGGKLVAKQGQLIAETPPKTQFVIEFEEENSVQLPKLSLTDFQVKLDLVTTAVKVRTIVSAPGSILTEFGEATLPVIDGVLTIPENRPDLCHAIVFNRYGENIRSYAVFQNFGLKAGAIASTIAHDGHNLIVIFRDSVSAHQAVNALISSGGGVAYVDGEGELYLQQLEVGGLMTTRPAQEGAADIACLCEAYAINNDGNNAMGIAIQSLTVAPFARISDRGLVDTINECFADFIIKTFEV